MRRHHMLRPRAAPALAVVVAVGATLALASGLTAAPEVLDSVGESPPRATAQHYRAVHADEETFTAVRCYCGCEPLGHRSLRDCFLTAQGTWEPHADGCGVCIAEAIDVATLRADGNTIDDIITRIDERFGAILAKD